MSPPDRLDEYRAILGLPPKRRPATDPDLLAEAFARALRQFTTEDGSLKVWNQGGSYVKGG